MRTNIKKGHIKITFYVLAALFISSLVLMGVTSNSNPQGTDMILTSGNSIIQTATATGGGGTGGENGGDTGGENGGDTGGENGGDTGGENGGDTGGENGGDTDTAC